MPYPRLHLGDLERLANVIARSFPDGLLGDFLVAVTRHQDHVTIVQRTMHPAEHLETVHFVHLDVADDQLRRNHFELIEGLRGIHKGERVVPEFPAGGHNELHDVRFVVNDDYFGHG
jgi:hypothetical protein